MLLREGSDPNERSEGGMTPLMIAAREGYAEIARILLAVGADVNATNEVGATALRIAVYNGSGELWMRATQSGAKAIERSALWADEKMDHEQTARYLIDRGGRWTEGEEAVLGLIGGEAPALFLSGQYHRLLAGSHERSGEPAAAGAEYALAAELFTNAARRARGRAHLSIALGISELVLKTALSALVRQNVGVGRNAGFARADFRYTLAHISGTFADHCREAAGNVSGE